MGIQQKFRHLIVGIGASAGGLAAFKSFLANLPVDTGMAFVLVQHLAPDHKSLLVELLAAKSPLPVVTAMDGMAVKPNSVYVIPPDATLTIVGGVLRIVTPAPARQDRRPIDAFFVSLAEDQGECAVGIILAGVGSDGSLGIRAIKEHAGLTMAQAEFDHHAMSGMPSSANATGMVDQVMPVEAMPQRLIGYAKLLTSCGEHANKDGLRNDIHERLPEIMSLLKASVKHDFSGYKQATMTRRLQRRMLVLQIDRIDDYIDRLGKEPAEAATLFQEVLIGVTEFFRDTEAFEALKKLVIGPILASKKSNDIVRVWIAGCSTGEEVYSIAILIKEALSVHPDGRSIAVKIFGTDIDARAINFARAGHYRSAESGLSPERAARWFTSDGINVSPVREIREMCVFSTHSIIKDPPFSRLDLISCRNVLIYLDNDLQSRVARTFQYALNAGGYLFLGTSEGIGRHASSFAVLDKTHRIFQRNNDEKFALPLSKPSADLTGRRSSIEPSDHPAFKLHDWIDTSVRRFMDHYAPAYFVIDRENEILRFSGSEARHYLEPSPGTANLHLYGILQKTLRPAVRSAVQHALETRKTVITENLVAEIDGKSRAVSLIVEPIVEGVTEGANLCIVAFRESAPFSVTAAVDPQIDSNPNASVVLEKELQATRFQLRAASDELETLLEDMNAANEEFQAVNEELQSSNEELETAKEEMQSINEELQTVNSELAGKNDQLTRLNSDLRNLLDSTRIATVFLDDDLCIRHFTPALTELFPLRRADRGRPITEIVNLLDYASLKQDVTQVQTSHAMAEHEVSLKDKSAAFLLRIQPYRTLAGVIDGVVLTFVDISERKRVEVHTALLAKELQHRTGNLLTVAIAIANRTFANDRPNEEARQIFAARLTALAKGHALLLTDPGRGGLLGDIVAGELASFTDRVDATGPLVILTPAATQSFALIIHELATNAAKYGALANNTGRIAVQWWHTHKKLEKSRLSFRWQERGGPLIEIPPVAKGFGSTLLERAINDGGQPAKFDYAPEGLTYDLNVPLDSISADGWQGVTPPADGGRDPSIY